MSKVKNTQVAHRTENGRRTKCGMRIDGYSDIVNDKNFKIPTRYHEYKFTPYKYEYAICKKCSN